MNQELFDVFKIGKTICPSHSSFLYPIIKGGSGFCFETRKLNNSRILVTVICSAYGKSNHHILNIEATDLMNSLCENPCDNPKIYGECYFVLDKVKVPLSDIESYL